MYLGLSWSFWWDWIVLGTFKVSLPVKGGNGYDVAYNLMILDVGIVDEVSNGLQQ